jgi:hypothetical protein
VDAPAHERTEPLNYHFGSRDAFCVEWNWEHSSSTNVFEATDAHCCYEAHNLMEM